MKRGRSPSEDERPQETHPPLPEVYPDPHFTVAGVDMGTRNFAVCVIRFFGIDERGNPKFEILRWDLVDILDPAEKDLAMFFEDHYDADGTPRKATTTIQLMPPEFVQAKERKLLKPGFAQRFRARIAQRGGTRGGRVGQRMRRNHKQDPPISAVGQEEQAAGEAEPGAATLPKSHRVDHSFYLAKYFESHRRVYGTPCRTPLGDLEFPTLIVECQPDYDYWLLAKSLPPLLQMMDARYLADYASYPELLPATKRNTIQRGDKGFGSTGEFSYNGRKTTSTYVTKGILAKLGMDAWHRYLDEHHYEFGIKRDDLCDAFLLALRWAMEVYERRIKFADRRWSFGARPVSESKRAEMGLADPVSFRDFVQKIVPLKEVSYNRGPAKLRTPISELKAERRLRPHVRPIPPHSKVSAASIFARTAARPASSVSEPHSSEESVVLFEESEDSAARNDVIDLCV